MQGGPIPCIGSLVPGPGWLGCDVFPHRIPDTFARDATSLLPPAESLRQLLLFPAGRQPALILLELLSQQILSPLEHVLEFCCFPLCLQVLLPDIL